MIKTPIGKSINAEQRKELLDKAVEYAKKVFTEGEKQLCAIVQQKPMLNLLPHSIVVTNKRVIRCIPKIFGAKFEDFLWKDLKSVHLNEKLLGCELIFEFENGTITLDKLPKNQAKKIYSVSQEREEEWIEKNRLRMIEETRAASGASQIMVSTTTDQSGTKAKLLELKNLLDEGLITQDEYHKKKDIILKEF